MAKVASVARVKDNAKDKAKRFYEVVPYYRFTCPNPAVGGPSGGPSRGSDNYPHEAVKAYGQSADFDLRSFTSVRDDGRYFIGGWSHDSIARRYDVLERDMDDSRNILQKVDGT